MTYLAKWVRFIFEELTGYSLMSIYKKIDTSQWPQGVAWKKAPDGHVLVNLEWYEQWLEWGEAKANAFTPARSPKGSRFAASARFA